LRLAALLAIAAAGCGGSGLTCEVLQDPENCWAKAAGAMRACLPGLPAMGTLSADRTSCTFPGGARVVFDTALPSTTEQLETFGFTAFDASGAECGSFLDSFQNHMHLEAGGSLAVSELHAGSEFHLHCGGGPSYEGDFDVLFTCPAFSAPTDGFSVAPAQVSFTISAVTTPGELFRCAP